MTNRSFRHSLLAPLAALAFLFVGLGACSGGRSVDEPSCEDGASRPAEDGCNTCTCNGREWVCTVMACAEPACQDGQSAPADDGCNTCSCYEGQWACTEMACAEPEPTCVEGATQPSDDGCNACTCANGSWVCTQLACQ